MKEWTGIEIERARQSLEDAAATVLGRMIFAFSRLDVALALNLVWSTEGSQLEELTGQFEESFFHKKLNFLRELVTAKYNDQKDVYSLYDQWLEDADAIRNKRNEFVHGRWGVDPIKNEVVNVIKLPTSPDQRSMRYSIRELKNALDQIEELEVRLAELREKWPV